MPVEIYRPSHFTEPDGVGFGDNYGTNVTTTAFAAENISQWASTFLIVGDPAKTGGPPSNDAFMNYHWGPHASRPTQVVIPKGSTINAAKMTVRPQLTEGVGSTVRIGVLVRNPTFQTTDIASWYAALTTASRQRRWHILSEMLLSSVVVTDPTVRAPGATNTSTLIFDRLGSGPNPADGVHSAGQLHIVTAVPGPDAEIDEVVFMLAKIGTPASNDIIIKIYSQPAPTDHLGAGTTLLATSDPVDIASLTNSLVATSFFFTPTVQTLNVGGAIQVFAVIDGDFGPGELQTSCFFAGGANTFVSHTFGRGSGLGPLVYPYGRDLPHISGSGDDILNTNLLGSTINKVIAGTGWVQDVDVEFTGLETMFQEQLDDAAFAAGDAMAVVLETLTAAIVGRRMYSSAYLPSDLAPFLTIDFTAPEIISFVATPTSIPLGAGSLLTWETASVDTVSIDQGVGSVPVDGQVIVNPTETTTFKLTATSDTTVLTAQVTVTVTPLVLIEFTPSETSIANAALILLGERTVGSLNDNTKAAQLIAERFNELRDQLLRLVPWAFANRRLRLAVDVEATPVWGFLFTYPLPGDCLRLIEIDNPFTEEYRVEGRAVVTNVDPLDILYTTRVTDTVQMDVLFRQTLSAYIAVTMAEAITGSLAKLRQVFEIFSDRLAEAKAANGQEPNPRSFHHSEHELARGKIEDF